MTRFASGKWAHATCERCGLTCPYKRMKSDGDTPGLRVCPECYDPEHPQDNPAPYLKKLPDAEALRHPTPDDFDSVTETAAQDYLDAVDARV